MLEMPLGLTNQSSVTNGHSMAKTVGKVTRAETRHARTLFLFGDGKGKRIVDVSKLSKASGVHEQTIRKYLPVWEKEYEDTILNASEVGLAIKLSEETLNENNKDLAFIRDKMNSLRFEIDSLDDIIARLEDICENFSLNSENGDKSIRLFENYLRSSMNRRSLLSLFIALKKEWDEKSALDGLRDVALVREKEISKGKARLEVKKLESGTEPQNRTPLGGGVFDRKRIETGRTFETGADEE